MRLEDELGGTSPNKNMIHWKTKMVVRYQAKEGTSPESAMRTGSAGADFVKIGSEYL